MSVEGSIIDGNGLVLWDAQTLGEKSGRGKRWVYRAAAENGLPAVRVGGRLFFRPEDYRAWLEAQTA
jgi:hypothetical protein